MPDLADCVCGNKCCIPRSRCTVWTGSSSLASQIFSNYLNSIDPDSQCHDPPPFPCFNMSQVSGLSRQDTLPAEDPSWSYSPVPGQLAPIPPRNEPLLFIPNYTAHDDAPCLKNLSKDHLAISKSNPRIETLKKSSTNIVIDHHSDSDNVCSPSDLVSHPQADTINLKGAKAVFNSLEWWEPPVGNGFVDHPWNKFNAHIWYLFSSGKCWFSEELTYYRCLKR